MEKTPTFKSKSKYLKNNNQEFDRDNLNSSNSKIFESESPGYIPCTQEGFENIDVTWDWNSPQSKKKPKKSQKRLALGLPLSPKKTLKKHLSNNSIQGFEKIQEELRLLKEEIAIPEHEESLVLSPIEEAEYKNVNSDSINNIELENFINETEDFFNDSFDEQLLDCTTQVENQLNGVIASTSYCDSKNNFINNKSENKLEKIPNVTIDTKQQRNNSHLNSNTVNLEESHQICNNHNLKLKGDKSDNSVVTLGKVEFHRTQSFEMSYLENVVGLPTSKKEEIERKRQEALAKLELKKKQGSLTISPMQCTSEEIERKRQEALAKREARRQQEIIEKNRQNALKRLEMTRKKNAQTVKSSLASRLS